MSHASLAVPFAPALDPATVAAVRRNVARAARAAAFTAASLAAAAFVWLLLAGPGFTSDHASTVHSSARHATR